MLHVEYGQAFVTVWQRRSRNVSAAEGSRPQFPDEQISDRCSDARNGEVDTASPGDTVRRWRPVCWLARSAGALIESAQLGAAVYRKHHGHDRLRDRCSLSVCRGTEDTQCHMLCR